MHLDPHEVEAAYGSAKEPRRLLPYEGDNGGSYGWDNTMKKVSISEMFTKCSSRRGIPFSTRNNWIVLSKFSNIEMVEHSDACFGYASSSANVWKHFTPNTDGTSWKSPCNKNNSLTGCGWRNLVCGCLGCFALRNMRIFCPYSQHSSLVNGVVNTVKRLLFRFEFVLPC